MAAPRATLASLTPVAALAQALTPVLLVQAWTWTVPRSRPRVADALFALALLFLLGWWVRRHGPRTAGAFGLTPGPDAAAVRRMAVITGLGLTAVLAAGWWRGDLALRSGWLRSLLTYPVSAALQQALVAGVLLPRVARAARGDRQAALITALLFALAHTPNPWLMLGGGVLQYALLRAWQARPSLLLAGLGQGLVGAAAHKLLDISMRVGRSALG